MPQLRDQPTTLDLREMMAQLLTLEGYKAETVANGRDALEYLHQGDRPDLILLDLMMPRAGGFDVIENLATTRPDVLNKVIVMTAAAGLVKHESLRRVHNTVTKPFTITDLLTAVRACIADARRDGIAASGV